MQFIDVIQVFFQETDQLWDDKADPAMGKVAPSVHEFVVKYQFIPIRFNPCEPSGMATTPQFERERTKFSGRYDQVDILE